ncbi:hypothetical protein ABAC460_07750 [Asticcacaulis sp. AC460]|uniref:DUF924 family protein n=1 Tax=Asticcacaulis sp. AC460 TaxID=1282360 RepID=UPI0003C3D192|nr:DUF924 family protein [Asticcacaulis sp. AC460]ESQ90714.1 hypothetical protein ABAC460_07750 [Asticcacaulis sp. AC460]
MTQQDDSISVIDFWFRELTPDDWFQGGAAIDALIHNRFSALLNDAREGKLDAWAATPRGRLALILVLDQFSRNLHRGSPDAFAGDGKAQTLTIEGVELGMDKGLTFDERQFFYMPLMHAENPARQSQCVAHFTALKAEAEGLLAFAEGHAAVVTRFGRFPHRNAVMGRVSTAEEQLYLATEDTRSAGG